MTDVFCFSEFSNSRELFLCRVFEEKNVVNNSNGEHSEKAESRD